MQPSKKTVFVTGAAGFIGCNLVHNLLANDAYRVIGIDKLTYAGNLNSLAGVMKNPNFSFEKTDICDAKAITDIFDRYKPSGIMHLAAESHVDRSIDGQELFIQTNIVGTYRLLQASREYVDRTGSNGSFRFLRIRCLVL